MSKNKPPFTGFKPPALPEIKGEPVQSTAERMHALGETVQIARTSVADDSRVEEALPPIDPIDDVVRKVRGHAPYWGPRLKIFAGAALVGAAITALAKAFAPAGRSRP